MPGTSPVADPNPSVLAYPEFPDPLTGSAIGQLFTPKPDELRWVWVTSTLPEARLGRLCLLKAFPVLGRFPVPNEIPAPIVEYIATRAGLEGVTPAAYPERTRARHRVEIRRYLGIHA